MEIDKQLNDIATSLKAIQASLDKNNMVIDKTNTALEGIVAWK